MSPRPDEIATVRMTPGPQRVFEPVDVEPPGRRPEPRTGSPATWARRARRERATAVTALPADKRRAFEPCDATTIVQVVTKPGALVVFCACCRVKHRCERLRDIFAIGWSREDRNLYCPVCTKARGAP